MDRWQSLVYCNGLENRRTLIGTAGPNPALSSIKGLRLHPNNKKSCKMDTWVSGLNQFPAKEPILRDPAVRICSYPPCPRNEEAMKQSEV